MKPRPRRRRGSRPPSRAKSWVRCRPSRGCPRTAVDGGGGRLSTVRRRASRRPDAAPSAHAPAVAPRPGCRGGFAAAGGPDIQGVVDVFERRTRRAMPSFGMPPRRCARSGRAVVVAMASAGRYLRRRASLGLELALRPAPTTTANLQGRRAPLPRRARRRRPGRPWSRRRSRAEPPAGRARASACRQCARRTRRRAPPASGRPPPAAPERVVAVTQARWASPSDLTDSPSAAWSGTHMNRRLVHAA